MENADVAAVLGLGENISDKLCWKYCLKIQPKMILYYNKVHLKPISPNPPSQGFSLPTSCETLMLAASPPGTKVPD